jgi:uncharacterized protein YgiM (DUF1202 family)
MLKYILSGMAVGVPLLLPLGLSQPLADAQERIRVSDLCPQATWTGNASVYELMPLLPNQFKQARVVSEQANVRSTAGFANNILSRLNRGASVTVTGETWDRSCDQWMQVQVGAERRWMHGSTLTLVGNSPSRPGNPNRGALTPVASLCPQATWTTGYYIGELIPLAVAQYKSAIVLSRVANVRPGAGFDSAPTGSLAQNEPVIILGEAWDRGCNQWMQVQIGAQRRWMHGYDLRLRG